MFNIKKWFKNKQQPSETKLPSLVEVLKQLQTISTEIDELIWYIAEHKQAYTNEQTILFSEKLSFALRGLVSNLGHAKDKERSADKEAQVAEIIKEHNLGAK